MNQPKKSAWPFRHLSQKSSWPMQGIVVAFAVAVLETPAEDRAAATSKMIERSFRIGARLAREFGADPVALLRVAQRQIEREIPGAQDAIATACADEHAEAFTLASQALGK